MPVQPAAPHPFDTQVEGDLLTVVIRKEFDLGNLHQDWAHAVLTLHPGPFKTVRLDLSRCGLVSSTFYAGLIQLHYAFNNQGTAPLVLHHPDQRMLHTLAMLHLDRLFTIEPR